MFHLPYIFKHKPCIHATHSDDSCSRGIRMYWSVINYCMNEVPNEIKKMLKEKEESIVPWFKFLNMSNVFAMCIRPANFPHHNTSAH